MNKEYKFILKFVALLSKIAIIFILIALIFLLKFQTIRKTHLTNLLGVQPLIGNTQHSQIEYFLFYYMKFPSFTYIIAYFSYNSNSFLKVCLSLILNFIFSLAFLCIYDIFHIFVAFLCIFILAIILFKCYTFSGSTKQLMRCLKKLYFFKYQKQR